MRRLLAIAALAVAGCSSWKLAPPTSAAARPFAPLPSNAAEICVVRTSVLAGAVAFPTRDNDVLVGATRGPTYFCYFAEAGYHDIEIEADDPARATLVAEAGHRYWLKQEVDNVFGMVLCRPVWLAEEEAKKTLADSSNEVLVGVPGEEALPPDAPYARAKQAPNRAAR